MVYFAFEWIKFVIYEADVLKDESFYGDTLRARFETPNAKESRV